MAKNTEQLKKTYENGIKVLTEALGSESTLRKLGKNLFTTLESTKKAAQEIVRERTIKNPNSFDFTEIETVDRTEKELRKNEIAKALLEGGFAAEDAAFEKKQGGNSNAGTILAKDEKEEIIPDF